MSSNAKNDYNNGQVNDSIDLISSEDAAQKVINQQLKEINEVIHKAVAENRSKATID